jgi:HPt (histidine-containing phosphotransfer) domain-containing protein
MWRLNPYPRMENEPVLDPEAIESLRALDPEGKGQLFRELVQIFLTDTPGRIRELGDALASKDAQAVMRAAHSMKGSAGNFGAARFAAVNHEIEANAREGKLDAIAALVPQVDAEFQRVKAALQALV